MDATRRNAQRLESESRAIYRKDDVELNIPRPEHPDPQRFRSAWINLNGPWDFAVDAGRNGLDAGWSAAKTWPGQRKITVPFCPESKLSGVEIKDFMPAVWYRRTFAVPAEWKGKRVRLHFGAVDFDCRVWVNGQPLGPTHRRLHAVLV